MYDSQTHACNLHADVVTCRDPSEPPSSLEEPKSDRTTPSATAPAEERRVSGSEVFARLLLISNTSKGLSVGHSPDGWFLIDELLTLEEWIDRQGGERGRERGRENMFQALNLEQRVRTKCMIHSPRACYRAHYLVKYLPR